MPAGTQFVETEAAAKAPDLTNSPAPAGKSGPKELPVSPELSPQAVPADVAASLAMRHGPAAMRGLAGVQSAFGNGYANEVVARLRETRSRERIATAEPPDRSASPAAASAPVTTQPVPKGPSAPPPAASSVVAPAPKVAPAAAPPKAESPRPATPPAGPAPAGKSAAPAPATPQAALAAPAPVPPKPESASPLGSQGKEPAPGEDKAPAKAEKGPAAAEDAATAKGGAAAKDAATAGPPEANKKKEAAPAGPGKTSEPAAAPGATEPVAIRKSPASPQDDLAFLAVVSRTKAVAHREGHNNPAQQKAMEAQAAAPGPANEVAGQAAAAQVGKMAGQKPNPFDKASFKAALMEKVKAITPKTLEEADDFKKDGKAASIKGDVTSQVDSGKQQAQGVASPRN